MNITSFDQCTGCSLCIHSCPVSAIEQDFAEHGAFWHPKINETKCIECHKCVAVCPQNHILELPEYESRRIVAQDTDISSLQTATSGGAASALSKSFIQQGGVVYGAAFGADMQLSHIRCTTQDECERIKGSKYVQSKIAHVYELIEQDLKEQRPVLFIGTPCQCVALKRAFDRYDAFFCCDFVCNGVGSPVIFQKHLAYLQKKYRCTIADYIFRPKKHKYLEPYERFLDVFGKEYRIKSPWKKWGSLYYSALAIRACCYDCRYAEAHRKVADITLSDIPMALASSADFPHAVDRYGASLLSVNSAKGKQLLQNCPWLYTVDADVEMKGGNHHASHDISARDSFLIASLKSLEKAKIKHLGYLSKIKGFVIEILDYIKGR